MLDVQLKHSYSQRILYFLPGSFYPEIGSVPSPSIRQRSDGGGSGVTSGDGGSMCNYRALGQNQQQL